MINKTCRLLVYLAPRFCDDAGLRLIARMSNWVMEANS